MDLDALAHPRGSLPPGVYWRRRIVLFMAVVVALLVLRSWVTSDPAPRSALLPSTSPSPSASTGASRSPSPTAAVRVAGEACRAPELRIEATVGARVYAGSARPVLTLAVTNTGPVACVQRIGQAVQELRVTSGGKRTWSSDDCAPGGESSTVTLQKGQRRVLSTVHWARRRSAPSCPADQPLAAPGTYRVGGRLGERTANGDVFSLRA